MLGIHRALIVLMLAFCIPVGAAQASVVSGMASDPAGDIESPEGYVAMNDVLSYSASYDSTGRIDVSVQYAAFGRPSDGIHNPHPDFWVYASFGRWETRTGRCSAPALDANGNFNSALGVPGDAVVGIYEGAGIPQVRATVIGHDPQLRRDGLTYDPGAARFSGYVQGISLAGRGYDCLTSIVSTAHGTLDTVTPFCMGPTGTATCTRSVPAEAKWISPKDGQTISGIYSEGGAHNCLVRVAGPVVRTENYVDGQLHDTQINPPWSCEWDTRDVNNGVHTLAVKAYDAAGSTLR